MQFSPRCSASAEEALAAQAVREQREERRTYYRFTSILLRENLYGRLRAPRRLHPLRLAFRRRWLDEQAQPCIMAVTYP